MSGRSGRRELPAGLRRAYVETLAPVALLAPVPLYFTDGASGRALVLYALALAILWWRARQDRPIRIPDVALNLAGLSYFLWLGFEMRVLHHGLLRSVTYLLLFTALAKLSSLKTAGEARTALLVLFLLTLAAASSSTHVSSIAYLAGIAILGFLALARLAVLADFSEAPPRGVLRAVPTRAVSAAGLAGAALLCAPLFYGLPRLKGPYAVAPFRLDDAFATTLAADRVDLESFVAAKRSDRVVLRLTADPADWKRIARLREAVFIDYRDGVWTRRPGGGRVTAWLPPETAPLFGREPVRIDLNPFAKGFLFVPYGTASLRVESNRNVFPLADGVLQLSSGRGSVSYEIGLGKPARDHGIGNGAIDPASVPPKIREYAARLLGDETDPVRMYDIIRRHLQKDFLYTLEPPIARGDPIVDFLTHSRAGHCEFFASAAAMMLASKGVPARLVTGSYGGEVGFFSRSIVVRGGNLHAWVEANLDGAGFQVLDPTPPAGVPPATSRLSFWRRLATLGREVEFFYDRRVLGFEALDQQRFLDAARDRLERAGRAASSWKPRWRWDAPSLALAAALLVLAAAAVLLSREWIRRRRRIPAATRAYIVVRTLLARKVGAVSDSVPPAEVARRFATAEPGGEEDASAIVTLYCGSAFGGREVGVAEERELAKRVRRLRKLA